MADRRGSDVLASAAAGDEIAFRRIIAAHHEDMRRVCAYIAGDLTMAEEATQAAWVIAWKRLRDVRELRQQHAERLHRLLTLPVGSIGRPSPRQPASKWANHVPVDHSLLIRVKIDSAPHERGYGPRPRGTDSTG